MSETKSELTEKSKKQIKLALAKSFGGVEVVGRALGLKLAEYLLEGEDGTVLLELTQAIQSSSQAQQNLQRRGFGRNKKLGEFFKLPSPPSGYYRRLGEVIAPFSQYIRSSWQGDSRLPDWFNQVLEIRVMVGAEGRVAPLIEDLGVENGYDVAIDVAVNFDANDNWTVAKCLHVASDWLEILEGRHESLSRSLLAAKANPREESLAWLSELKYDFAKILPTVVELSLSSSKKVRARADTIISQHKETVAGLLEEKLRSGNATERAHAAEKLFLAVGEQAVPVLKAALKEEKGKRVRQTIENCLQNIALADSADGEEDRSYDLTPVKLPPLDDPLPQEFVEALWEQFQLAFDKLDQQHAKKMASFNSPERPRWMRSPPPKPSRIDRKEFGELVQFIEGKKKQLSKFSGPGWVRNAIAQMPSWSNWANLKSINFVHVARFFYACEFLNANYFVYLQNEDWIEAHRVAQDEPYDLRVVDAVFALLPKFESGAIAKAYLSQNDSWRTFLDWEGDAVWPLFVERGELFRNAILGASGGSGDYWVQDRRNTALRVAAMMPHLSRDVEEAMWSVALGEQKSSRAAARKALHAARNKLPRVLAAVADGKQGVRIAGAEMAAEVGDPAAIEPLKKALKKEKLELVKGSLLLAIEQLGGDVQEFLGRKKQLLDAQKGLEKKRPKGMEWVQLENLPGLHWEEDGKPVAAAIVQWWVIQSIQFKQPICGPILKRALDMCKQQDAAAFARFVLSAWTAHDTRLPNKEELVAKATKQAQSHWGSGGGWLQNHYGTVNKYRDALMKQMQNEFLGSAIGQKGLLAIVSAAGDAECVKMIDRYIRTYHGNRLAQSKALLETLAHIDHSSAVQLLLSLGNRFRTKAIRKRAEELVHELAERQGWTMAQLADRTIPDAGFAREKDDKGNPIGDRDELVLDYGSRKFSVVLNDDLVPVITRDDGKQVKSLPSAAKADDPDLVKAAKKEFSAAKKVVKEVVRLQAERCYEAACIQSGWPATEWRTYLATHPIAGALCRRVVWAAYENEEQATTNRLFRPLEDGTLTDVNDEEFTLSDNDLVRVAHSSLLDAETESAWKQHLEDYEVPELFRQFGRETYRLPDELSEATEVLDFEGHVLTTFQLRNRAKKLGWQRGDAEDGGTFWIYYKSFRLEGVSAVVTFTGSYLPEEDLPAALKELYFEPMRPNDDNVRSWNPKPLKLSKVPPGLLSECYNDVREMAAEGSGFDAGWERVSLW